MTIVVGVRFKKPGKVYYFDPGELAETIAAGDVLVVETSRGLELGECMEPAREVEDSAIVAPLRKVERVATERDLRQVESNQENERNAYNICQEKIIAHKIEMKLVDVEFAFDNSKIIFYFTANGRVDFRSLVKDLASVFKTRIELRQIGVRDEAKMLGGLGPCGRPICCGTFLGDFQPVSIKMAKEQSLSLNPTKISGLCGRLMCCLKYEQDNYEEARKKLPRVGKDVMTPDGRGHVIDLNVLKQTAKVRIFVGDTSEVREYPGEELQRVAPQDAEKRPPRKPQEEADTQQAAQPPAHKGKGRGRHNQQGEGEKPQRDGERAPHKRREQPERAERAQPANVQANPAEDTKDDVKDQAVPPVAEKETTANEAVQAPATTEEE